MTLEKNKVFHDYKSFASMGLVRFNEHAGAKAAEDELKQSASKKTQVRLDMALKPEKMECNAGKIKTDLELNMHEDPQVAKFCEQMRKADTLPELELARQEEESFRKKMLPDAPKPPKIKYVIARKSKRNLMTGTKHEQ